MFLRPSLEMNQLCRTNQVDRLFEAGTHLIFKHSTRCPISAAAEREVVRFEEQGHADVGVHLLRVIEERELSGYLESRSGIRHESPQVLLLEDGQVVWHCSHYSVLESAMSRQVALLAGRNGS